MVVASVPEDQMLQSQRTTLTRLLWFVVGSVVTGVVAGLLVVGAQYLYRVVEKHGQEQQTRRYVDDLEQIVSQNPVRITIDGVPDAPTGSCASDDMVFLTSGGHTDKLCLTTDSVRDARELVRLANLEFALDRLSLHLDNRAVLISQSDRFIFNAIIFDTRASISRYQHIRERRSEKHEGKRLVGLAEPLGIRFFTQLRDSIDWLRE